MSTGGYARLIESVAFLLEEARRRAARSVNTILAATYWEVGRRIVEFEQGGEARAEYGEELLAGLSRDLTARLGRGFARSNLYDMRSFYLTYSHILQTASGESTRPLDSTIIQTASGGLPVASKDSQILSTDRQKSEAASRKLVLDELSGAFPLSWSHYVLLMRRSKSPEARRFYEVEALRDGWSVRQLERQINSQFYERTALSRNKAAMLKQGSETRPEDEITPEEEIKDPYILEFLGLKDEYSESELEEALILHLQAFLLELGRDFTFVARQKRQRIGDEWYKVDLVFFHRGLRCLVLVDLKLGKFTHADAGQMHLYLNYAGEHWTLPGENPPVGLILCAHRDAAVARYALDGLPNKVMAAEYRTALPDEKLIAHELERTRRRMLAGWDGEKCPECGRGTLRWEKWAGGPFGLFTAWLKCDKCGATMPSPETPGD